MVFLQGTGTFASVLTERVSMSFEQDMALAHQGYRRPSHVDNPLWNDPSDGIRSGHVATYLCASLGSAGIGILDGPFC